MVNFKNVSSFGAINQAFKVVHLVFITSLLTNSVASNIPKMNLSG